MYNASDYINYRRIGVCSAGELKSLGLDTDMCLPTDFNSCGDSIKDKFIIQKKLGYYKR